MRYGDVLQDVVSVVREVGHPLRQEMSRSGGPRGAGSHADIDEEVEALIRRHLTSRWPDFAFRGEETGFKPAQNGSTLTWLVDPNDGTAAYLRGFRGASTSVALLEDGVPVLGVVYAYAAPDHSGDLFAWAEGCGLPTRNGQPIYRAGFAERLGALDVVAVSQDADRVPLVNRELVAPGRFLAVPSVAYRLALVAAGDADACVSLAGPCSWDYAAGHALLLAVGGTLVDETGAEVTYTRDGSSRTRYCFGGGREVVEVLAQRPWDQVFGPRTAAPEAAPLELSRLKRGDVCSDPIRLERAQGTLLGQLAGDALGSLVEFQSARSVAAAYPDGGPRWLADGGTWSTIAGQATDDSELALMLARTIVKNGGYDAHEAARAYRYWYRSRPFDIGNTTARALSAISGSAVQSGFAHRAAQSAANADSQANGSLMRISPLAVWGSAALDDDSLAARVRIDSSITHPHAACGDACAIFAIAISYAIRSGTNAQMVYQHVCEWVRRTPGTHGPVVEALFMAAGQPPPPESFSGSKQGWVLIALQNAFYRLLHSRTMEHGIVDTVRMGGDTDTNGAIAGALLGAVHGRRSVPTQWSRMIRTCRPLPGAVHPRPQPFWPVDVLELAERLLLAREA